MRKKILLILIFFLIVLGVFVKSLFFPDPQINVVSYEDTQVYTFRSNDKKNIVSLREIPEDLKKALLIAQERNFYAREPLTWTQYIKNTIFRSNENKTQNPILQAHLAHQLAQTELDKQYQSHYKIDYLLKLTYFPLFLENTLSKDQLLELYFNEISFAPQNKKLKEATQLYFNKEIKDLTLAQAAVLAGLPPSPNHLLENLDADGKALWIIRATAILQEMKGAGYITEEKYHTSVQELETKNFMKAPHTFTLYVLQESTANKTTDQEIAKKVEQLNPELQSKIKITENDIASFHYGFIELTPEGSEKIKNEEGIHYFFFLDTFAIYFDNKPLLFGTLHDSRLASIPSHTYLTFPLVLTEDTRDTFSFLEFRFYPSDSEYQEEVKLLQNYFYSIGKASEPWKEQT